MLCLKCIPGFCWPRAELEQQLQEVQPEQEPMDSTAAVPHPFTTTSLQPWAAAVWSSDGKQRPKMNQDWIAEGNTVCLKPALVAQWHRDVPGPPGWAWQGQPQPSVPHDFFFPRKNRCLLSTASAWAGTKHRLHCYCWPCSTHLGCIYWLLRSWKGLEQSEYLIFLSHVLIKGLQRAWEHLLPQPHLRTPLAKLNKRALHLLLVWFFCNASYYLFEGVN